MVVGKPWETSLRSAALEVSKGFPPQHWTKPFETSEAKRPGRKGWKFKFPALSPCLFGFRGLKVLSPRHQRKPFETSEAKKAREKGWKIGISSPFTLLFCLLKCWNGLIPFPCISMGNGTLTYKLFNV